jgi:hypothetical protein
MSPGSVAPALTWREGGTHVMKTGTVLVVGSVMALAITSILAKSARREGRWEVKVEMEMAGMTLPPQTSMQCVTKEEAVDPQKAMPQGGRGTPNNCKVSDYKMDGSKVTWSIACDQMTGAGEFTYFADSYIGIMRMKSQGKEMTMKYAGKRLGDCTK